MTRLESSASSPYPSETRPLARIWRSRWLPPALFVALFVAIWQVSAWRLDSSLLPFPIEVARFVWNELRLKTVGYYSVYYSFGLSLMRLAIGLAVTMVLGGILGGLMGMSRRFNALVNDFVVADLQMPFLVWALLWAIWTGFSFWTPIYTVVLASIPFVITNVAEGVRNVPKELVDMAQSYGVPRARVIRKVIFPSLIPFLLAGFRMALSLGWKSLALAELYGSDKGAGWMLRFWYDAQRITGLIGYALFFVAIAIVVDRVFLTWLTRRAFRWRAVESSTGMFTGRR
jgi:ABC-type nitrate/sulfonate/bicarbonate transport system permease component